MKILFYSCVLLASSAFAQTAPPAPSLTAGPDLKGLQFDWDAVAGATRYELEYKPNQNGAFAQLGGDLPASATSYRYRFPLHLFDWTYARYRLAACNATDCTYSTEISVSDLRRDAVGYFKAGESAGAFQFGADVDISPDGLNLVVAAPGEQTPVVGGPPFKGALYVFRRNSTGTWTQRAKLLPDIWPFIENNVNEMNVGISADGNTVVLGTPNDLHQAVDEQSGEVNVFRFNGNQWIRTRLQAGTKGHFGYWVGINDAGDTIAVASGQPANTAAPRFVFLYKLVNGNWQPVRGLRARQGAEFCEHGALSGDGSTVVQSCREGTVTTTLRYFVRTHSGPNWTVREDIPLVMSVPVESGYGSIGIAVDTTGNTIAAQIFGNDLQIGDDPPSEVQVFKRNGAYSRVAVLTPGAWRLPDLRSFYGLDIAVSGDGSTIAIGDAWDNGFGTGPRAAPLNPGTTRTGAIYVYRLGTTWRLANMVKPNYSPDGLPSSFGYDVALNGNGQTLIVGHHREGSNARGIGGSWSNNAAPNSGAVWLY